jgi:hypothetical protein
MLQTSAFSEKKTRLKNFSSLQNFFVTTNYFALIDQFHPLDGERAQSITCPLLSPNINPHCWSDGQAIGERQWKVNVPACSSWNGNPETLQCGWAVVSHQPYSSRVENYWQKLFVLTSVSEFCLHNMCNGQVETAAKTLKWLDGRLCIHRALRS